MTDANYFFIDGSALTAQIRQLWRSDASFQGRKLCPRRFIAYLINALPELHGNSYKRITFYFPKGDEAAIEDYLEMPDHKRPSEIRDMHFKFCGQKLKKSAEFLQFVEEVVPPKFQSRFSKSEKGIDIEIVCDALRLASASKIGRLFLFSNDSDFIPFCRTIKEFGANISIIHLASIIPPNLELLREVDSYDVVADASLEWIFLPRQNLVTPSSDTESEVTIAESESEETISSADPEKPSAPPSDLEVDDQTTEVSVPTANSEVGQPK